MPNRIHIHPLNLSQCILQTADRNSKPNKDPTNTAPKESTTHRRHLISIIHALAIDAPKRQTRKKNIPLIYLAVYHIITSHEFIITSSEHASCTHPSIMRERFLHSYIDCIATHRKSTSHQISAGPPHISRTRSLSLHIQRPSKNLPKSPRTPWLTASCISIPYLDLYSLLISSRCLRSQWYLTSLLIKSSVRSESRVERVRA